MQLRRQARSPLCIIQFFINNFQNLSWCGQVFGARAISGENVGAVGR